MGTSRDQALRNNMPYRLYTYFSVDYAWDEPTLLPHITLSVQGGTSGTYSMKNMSDGDQLCYKNFIYIAFTASFNEYVLE